jgi:Ca2+-binding RTX toxin-like protein
MKNLVRLKESRAVRLAASAVAVAAAIAGATGIAAGQGNAAPPIKAPIKNAKFPHPKLKHGVLRIKGTRASDAIALRLKAGDPDTLQVDFGDNGSADFSFARNRIAKIAVDARAGNDRVRIDDSNGAFTDTIPTTIDGRDGNDTVAGGKGNELLLGGDGTDSIDGNGGNDLALLGAGDDTFLWDPGDGSDTIEGQDGIDRMLFNGAGIAEKIELSANGNRLRFVRDIAGITMDTHGVERVDFNALGGADLVTVNELSKTDVNDVNVDLGGDGESDRVVVDGTNGDDKVDVSGDSTEVKVSGLAPTVAILHPEPTDELDVHTLGGNDKIDASALAAGAILFEPDGGSGDDTIAGSQGIDKALGGPGNDSIDGNAGNDLALLGAGDDAFVWDPGDGSDTVEGQFGADTMRFNGAGIAERIGLSANGRRLRLFRDVGTVTMDTNGVERVDVNALGGPDLVAVDDLSGTDVKDVNIDLAGTLGGASGDGQADQVVVSATNGDDAIDVSGDASEVKVSGLAPTVAIFHPEVRNDRLEINTLAGTDRVDSSGLAAGAIQLFVDGVRVR